MNVMARKAQGCGTVGIVAILAAVWAAVQFGKGIGTGSPYGAWLSHWAKKYATFI